MELLLKGQCAPTAEAIGFLQADRETTARALVSWRERIYGPGTVVVNIAGRAAEIFVGPLRGVPDRMR